MKKRPVTKIIGLVYGLSLTANAWSAGDKVEQVALLGSYTPYDKAREASYPKSPERAEILYQLGMDTKDRARDNNQLYEAFTWLKAAADMGLAKAQYVVGLMYADGLGVHRDEDKAIEWLSKASHQKHKGAEFAFAYMLKTDFFVGC